MKGLGLVQITVMVPTEDLEQFHEAAARARAARIQQALKEGAARRD